MKNNIFLAIFLIKCEAPIQELERISNLRIREETAIGIIQDENQNEESRVVLGLIQEPKYSNKKLIRYVKLLKETLEFSNNNDLLIVNQTNLPQRIFEQTKKEILCQLNWFELYHNENSCNISKIRSSISMIKLGLEICDLFLFRIILDSNDDESKKTHQDLRNNLNQLIKKYIKISELNAIEKFTQAIKTIRNNFVKIPK